MGDSDRNQPDNEAGGPWFPDDTDFANTRQVAREEANRKLFLAIAVLVVIFVVLLALLFADGQTKSDPGAVPADTAHQQQTAESRLVRGDLTSRTYVKFSETNECFVYVVRDRHLRSESRVLAWHPCESIPKDMLVILNR